MENIEITNPRQRSRQPEALVGHIDYAVFPPRDIDQSKLSATWDHLSRVPALEHSNPAAIVAAGEQ